METATFRPLAADELAKLRASLTRNVTDGAALLTGLDTSYLGDVPELPDDEAVVRAIKSVPCHYSQSAECQLALEMLRGDEVHIADARRFAPLGNSVVGSLLSLLHGVPRQYAEPAVCEALAILDRETHDALVDAEGGGQ